MPGASPTYRGYRLQAMYVLHRILNGTQSELVFRPEGIEDLDIYNDNEQLVEAIQVKSSDPLQLSHLGSKKKQDPYFKRAAKLLSNDQKIGCTIASFGEIGQELQKAWSDKNCKEYNEVAKKLQDKHDLTLAEVDLVHNGVELLSVDESTIYIECLNFIRNTAAGIEPEKAFDLFMQWIYDLSEKQVCVTKADIISRINGSGHALQQRNDFITEWHTSIKEIGGSAQEEMTVQEPNKLRAEFYAGASARYSHIDADLDFRRDDKLDAIKDGFNEENIVIVHGASGQGKTTLAYRYIHDHFPSTWRYEIVLIESLVHASKIASALNAQASILKSPLIVYLDVRPNDTNWPELIQQLTQHKYIQVLVTVREEDYRRVNLPRHRLDFIDLALDFNEDEACQIYARAIEEQSQVQARFIDFEASWEAFNEAGPLMEYVYLLTQISTLRERLAEQLSNITSEASGQLITDKWDTLRLVATASTHEARVSFGKLKNHVEKPSLFGTTLSQLEEEYLIRLSTDGHYIEGLHPIRSRILLDLMLKADPTMWQQTAQEAFPLLHEADLQIFALHSFVERSQSDQQEFLRYLLSYHPNTWTGIGGLLRSLLWVGIRDYIEKNRPLFDKIKNDFPDGWRAFIVDIVDVLEDPFLLNIMKQMPAENRLRFEDYHSQQSPKSEIFTSINTWLSSLTNSPQSPNNIQDWIGLAEVWGWAGHFGFDPQIDQWITEEELSELVHQYDLHVVGDVTFALYKYNPLRHQAWVSSYKELIDQRLANEFQILATERHPQNESNSESNLQIHFIPTPLDIAMGVRPSLLKRNNEDSLHKTTLERLELVQHLYPHYDLYKTKGYGFKHGTSLSLQHDPTVRNAAASMIRPHWLIRANQLVMGIAEYGYRPETWHEYSDYIIEARQKAVECLKKLQKALLKSQGNRKSNRLIKAYMTDPMRDEVKKFLEWLPKLPKSVVDQWGYSSEANRASALSVTEAVSTLGVGDGNTGTNNTYTRSALANQKFTLFLMAQRGYLHGIKNFCAQSTHVLIIEDAKLQVEPQKVDELKQNARTLGIRPDFDTLSTQNLWSATTIIQEYQTQFRGLLGNYVNTDKLSKLEAAENKIVPEVWESWYYFANKSSSNRRAAKPKTVKQQKSSLDRRIKSVLDKLASPDASIAWKAHYLHTSEYWQGDSALWITIDQNSALTCYTSIDSLIELLWDELGVHKPNSLTNYLLEKHYKHFVIIPLVNGKLINPTCFAPSYTAILYNQKSIVEAPFMLAPARLSAEKLSALNLAVWEGSEYKFANQLADSAHTIKFIVSQLSEFNEIPEELITDAGMKSLQKYIEDQSKIIEVSATSFLEASSVLVEKIGKLKKSEYHQNPLLIECSMLLETVCDHLIIGEEDELQISLSDMPDYVAGLENVIESVETIRLAWIENTITNQYIQT